jgi:hypothetical protein
MHLLFHRIDSPRPARDIKTAYQPYMEIDGKICTFAPDQPLELLIII